MGKSRKKTYDLYVDGKGHNFPKRRFHKSSGYDYVHVNGRDYWLGPHDSERAVARYAALKAQWLSHGGQLPSESPNFTITQGIALYVEAMTRHYGADASELQNLKRAMRRLRAVHGPDQARDFTPQKLKALRVLWLHEKRPLSRPGINRLVQHIKRMFRWLVSEGHVPPEVYSAVQTVESLRKGRVPEASEPEPRQPVPEADVKAVKPFLPSPLAALVDLMLCCGARPSELLTLRPMDIDQSGDPWTVRPAEHKTAYKDRDRVILFGPRAQEVLRPFMLRAPHEYLFTPLEVEQERHIQARTHRRPDQTPNARKTDRTLGAHYTPASFRKAVQRACDKAGVLRFTPYQLRHTFATRVRAEYGLEASQVLLGHARADVSQICAQRDLALAARVAGEIG